MLYPIQDIIAGVKKGDFLYLSKAISHVENQAEGTASFLAGLTAEDVPVIGFTGPPGAGKSTLIASLVGEMVNESKRVAVLSVDPSSVIHEGALLGDRIRMREWYLHPSVYIRSLATRGHLGGLIQSIDQMVLLLKSAGFDFIILETVGVGQSEVQVAKIAYPTVLVLVPEAGDEIQMMKSGLFEVANIYVVNKSDRPEAQKFTNHLKQSLSDRVGDGKKTSLLQTTANTKEGVAELLKVIKQYDQSVKHG
ncbi:MAG: methylmalonyl Co-A mutase-associated GTPase MeaB [Bacteroidota bacterium]|jgi:LAO/AO transport system kinase